MLEFYVSKDYDYFSTDAAISAIIIDENQPFFQRKKCDVLLTPEQARQFARMLLRQAIRCERENERYAAVIGSVEKKGDVA